MLTTSMYEGGPKVYFTNVDLLYFYILIKNIPSYFVIMVSYTY